MEQKFSPNQLKNKPKTTRIYKQKILYFRSPERPSEPRKHRYLRRRPAISLNRICSVKRYFQPEKASKMIPKPPQNGIEKPRRKSSQKRSQHGTKRGSKIYPKMFQNRSLSPPWAPKGSQGPSGHQNMLNYEGFSTLRFQKHEKTRCFSTPVLLWGTILVLK